MDWAALPSLSALRALAAYSDHGSMAAAGAALNVSHAAVSQQIRGLEAHLGVPLLDRSGRQAVLTPEGERLAQATLEGLVRVVAVVEELTGADADRPLQVSLTPAFAANWLMPRLADFRRRHPEIDIMLNPTPDLADPTPGGIDIALRYGPGDWPGLDCMPLLMSPMVLVAAPALLDGIDPVTPEALRALPWLQELGTTEATDWLRRNGVTEARTRGLVQLPGNLMLDAARDGQGIAVTAKLFVENDIAAGRLRCVFEDEAPLGYHIVTRPGVLRPQARVFQRWLRRQVPVRGTPGSFSDGN